MAIEIGSPLIFRRYDPYGGNQCSGVTATNAECILMGHTHCIFTHCYLEQSIPRREGDLDICEGVMNPFADS